jgi:pyruvate/2-oxoglutarate/acetoin dehydrogenase E1 component
VRESEGRTPLIADCNFPAAERRMLRAVMPALETSLPISVAVARFVDRLTTLSPTQWEEIQASLTKRGLDVSMLEASRNASVALAVRDMITPEQFDHLYGPFSRVIPVDSLDGQLVGD